MIIARFFLRCFFLSSWGCRLHNWFLKIFLPSKAVGICQMLLCVCVYWNDVESFVLCLLRVDYIFWFFMLSQCNIPGIYPIFCGISSLLYVWILFVSIFLRTFVPVFIRSNWSIVFLFIFVWFWFQGITAFKKGVGKNDLVCVLCQIVKD